jgi:hypothetical protein
MTLGDLDRNWVRRAVLSGSLFILLSVVTVLGLIAGTRPWFQTAAVLTTAVWLTLLVCIIMLVKMRLRR